MVAYEVSVEIERPPDAVFAVATDVGAFPRWAPGVVDAGLEGGGPPGPGSRGYEVRRFLGRTVRSTWELTEWDPPRAFTMAFATRSVTGEGRFRLEEIGRGTRLTVAVSADAPRLLGPLFRREDRRILAAMKSALEAS